MIDEQKPALLQHLRKIIVGKNGGADSDKELLDRFHKRQDENAFAALMERHGSMVFGVCRRLLRNSHDAEDACQAVFLVLARKAGTIRKKDSIGSWLHGVAYRVASDLKRRLAREHTLTSAENDVADAATAKRASWHEIKTVLDEELDRLPERFQAPLILCYLEGKTRDEAAGELGWSLGALKGRLERGRALLRVRLIRRGLEFSAVLFSATLAEKVSASLAPAMTIRTIRAAAVAATTKTLPKDLLPAAVVSLANRFLTTSAWRGIAFFVAISVAILITGAIVFDRYRPLLFAGAGDLAGPSAHLPYRQTFARSDRDGERDSAPALSPRPDPLTSLFDKLVQAELKLSKQQSARITALAEKRKEAMKGLNGVVRTNKWKQAVAADILVVGKLLNEAQTKRFEEIRIQQLGPEAFLTARVREKLNISDEQVAKIRELTLGIIKKQLNVGLFLFGNRRQKWEQSDRQNKQVVQLILDTLSPPQQQQWDEIAGKAYPAVLPPPGRYPDILRTVRYTIRTGGSAKSKNLQSRRGQQ